MTNNHGGNLGQIVKFQTLERTKAAPKMFSLQNWRERKGLKPMNCEADNELYLHLPRKIRNVTRQPNNIKNIKKHASNCSSIIH